MILRWSEPVTSLQTLQDHLSLWRHLILPSLWRRQYFFVSSDLLPQAHFSEREIWTMRNGTIWKLKSSVMFLSYFLTCSYNFNLLMIVPLSLWCKPYFHIQASLHHHTACDVICISVHILLTAMLIGWPLKSWILIGWEQLLCMFSLCYVYILSI